MQSERCALRAGKRGDAHASNGGEEGQQDLVPLGNAQRGGGLLKDRGCGCCAGLPSCSVAGRELRVQGGRSLKPGLGEPLQVRNLPCPAAALKSCTVAHTG